MNKMEIQILFDNETIDKKLSIGWGFSCLVDNHILFDTGESPGYLFANMDSMGIDIDTIEAVVISHDHWDHTGGLWSILKRRPKLKIYACPHFSRRFKNKISYYECQLVEADKFIPISKNVYTTGEIGGRYDGKYIPEQSLVLRTPKGVTILTGCAHPGIIAIIENVRQNISGSIYIVLGGFHLKGKHRETINSIIHKFKELGVKKTAPGHCTGKTVTKIFKEKDVKGGNSIDKDYYEHLKRFYDDWWGDLDV